jgi:hypothetical protein
MVPGVSFPFACSSPSLSSTFSFSGFLTISMMYLALMQKVLDSWQTSLNMEELLEEYLLEGLSQTKLV